MNPFAYQKVFTGVTFAVAAVMGLSRLSSPSDTARQTGSRPLVPLLCCLGLILWMGLRPISDAFGDTVNYALEYATLDARLIPADWYSEWLWQWIMNLSKVAGLNVHAFFTLVAAGYVLSAFWALCRFMPRDPVLGTVFLLNSLMFFSFGVNGLRNGLACHLVLLAMSFLLDDKWGPGALVCIMALGIHRSTLLPIATILVGRFVFRDIRSLLLFWVASIFLSLTVGPAIENLFAAIGFDDRMTQYVTLSDLSEFSQTGFRWDFLLYSAAPVAMAWYVCIHKGLQDNWYNVICTAYLLCNAFWIMVIRSAFSNRFAYLSWFLYPLVIAYPLVNMPLREDQDRLTGLILLAYGGFSAFMWFIFW